MTTAASAAKPPVWRNVRFLRFAGQTVFVVALVVVVREAFLNLEFGVERQGVDLSFDFLERRAGFAIKEGIAYSPSQSLFKAYTVGVVNTIVVSVTGIVLATVLGLVIGVARLSPNWLVRKIAQVYVEVIRNVPVLVQVVFWYVVVLLALPVIEGGVSIGDAAFISNRGTALPWFHLESGSGVWAVFLGAAVVAGWLVWRWRTRMADRSGRPSRPAWWSVGAFLAVAVGGFLVAGTPVAGNVPEVERFGYRGGLQVSPEFTALLLGLAIYTSSFIAEIVRGSVQAVPKGQKEAAEAMGLSRAQQLRLVVLPQALRVAIPPLNSQYLNLTKNSSLGLAVAYPEIVQVSNTIINQAGRATQMLLLIMATYLIMSLVISSVMNGLNKLVASRGELR